MQALERFDVRNKNGNFQRPFTKKTHLASKEIVHETSDSFHASERGGGNS